MWHVPANHAVFDEMNTAQWLWYFYNQLQDQEEEFTKRRDLVEYHASFIEPEAVRKIRDAREKAIVLTNDEFNAGLSNMFGRPLTAERKVGGKIESVNPKAAIENYKEEVAQETIKGTNYQHWLKVKME